MARQFTSETNKSEAIRDVIAVLGVGASNADIKDRISEDWIGFKWSSNPAADIAAARKALAKAEGGEATAAPRRGRRPAKASAPAEKAEAASTRRRRPAAASAHQPIDGSKLPAGSGVRAALQLLLESTNPGADLQRAEEIVKMAGSAQKALDILTLSAG